MNTNNTNNGQFQWRPNDNSVSTKLKYELEAQHWYDAFKSVESSNRHANFGEVAGTVGLVISLILNLIFILLSVIVNIFLCILALFKIKDNDRNRSGTTKPLDEISDEDLDAIHNGKIRLKQVNVYDSG